MQNLYMGAIQNRVVRSARGIAATLKRPPYFAPGHFYSSATSAADRERAVAWRTLDPVGIDLRTTEQEQLAAELAPTMIELPEDRYRAGNAMYGRGDAAVLHAMLRRHRPARLLEVGSGYSTAVALDVAERHLPDLRITCVEPNPERLLSRLRDEDKVDLILAPVQLAPVELFAELEAGDILLIDSTHVAKAGSDVIWIYLHILPTLAPGVLVHVHDVDWPFEYPEEWIREGRDWTEAYLLRAFLTHNDAWRIRLMTRWLWTQRPDLVPAQLRGEPTGSLWMERLR